MEENLITGSQDSSWKDISDSNLHKGDGWLGQISRSQALTGDLDCCDVESLWSDNESLGGTSSSGSSISGTALTELTELSSTHLESSSGYDDDSESLGGTSFAGSSTSRAEVIEVTELSSAHPELPPGDDDLDEAKTEFPHYDGVGDSVQVENLEPLALSRSRSPRSYVIEDIRPLDDRLTDDMGISSAPERHVDYLSHQWREEDIWASRKHIKFKTGVYSNEARLLNVSWRTWGKIRSDLGTVSPETLNWLKDCDVTCLYGPLLPGIGNCSSKTSASKIMDLPANDSLTKNPILKKRSMSEMLLSRSISSSSLLKQAAVAVQAQNAEPLPFPSTLRNHENTSLPYSISPSAHDSPGTGERKHIHFNEQVEQCIAVEMKDDDDSDESDFDDGGIMLKRSNSKRKLPPLHSRRTTPRQSFSAESKTIAMLPSTTLKYRADTPEVSETVMNHSRNFWNGSKLSPSPSQETLRPSKPSTRLLLGDDEEDDEDLDWQPPSAFANRKDSISTTQERLKDLHVSRLSSNLTGEPSGMRRTQSGMFMPYEADKDDLVSEGLFAKCVDTVNTARDIACLMWNGGSTVSSNTRNGGSTTSSSNTSMNSLSKVLGENLWPRTLNSKIPGAFAEKSPDSHLHDETSSVVSRVTPSPTLSGDLMVERAKAGSVSSLDSVDSLTGVLIHPGVKSDGYCSEGSTSIFEKGGLEPQNCVSTTVRQNNLIPTEEPSASEAIEAGNGLLVASQLPNSILSGEALNAAEDGDGDSYQTVESYSGESDETGSSNSVCHEIYNVTEEGADGLHNIVISTLDPMRQAMVDRVMGEFWMIFNQSWDTGFRECTGGASAASSATSFPNGTGTLTSESSSSFGPRKRRRDDDDFANDKNGKGSGGPDGSLDPGRGIDEVTRFACPFRKHNSLQYSVYSHPVCALSHWETIARVKEHLYRGHRMTVHCKRCWKLFKTQEQLDSHLLVDASDICGVQTGHPPEGITVEHERRLRSRKKASPNQTDGDRWKDIYKLLFPNEEIPSPYFEPIQEERSMSPTSRDLASYEDYIRRELPRVVRSNIEEAVRQEMQPFEASLISDLVNIIQDSQERVFRSYRGTQGVVDEAPSDKDCEASSSGTPQIRDGSNSRPPLDPDQYVALQSDFIDTVLQPPPPLTSESMLPPLTRNDLGGNLPRLSSDTMLSDSGYYSEQLRICGCTGPCNCRSGDIAGQGMDDYNSRWNGWNAENSLDQLGLMGCDINWGHGV